MWCFVMVFVDPWNKKSLSIFKQLSLNGRAYSKDIKFIVDFSRREQIRDIVHKDFLDISRCDTKKRTWFVVPPDIEVVPKSVKRSRFGIHFHFNPKF